MLTPSQIADMKHKDPDAFNLWRLVTDAINEFGLQMGVDPKPANQVDVATAIPPPKAPKSINVVSIAGAVLVLLEAGEGNLPTAFYFVESSTTKTFQQVTRYTLGHGLHLAVPMAAGVTYWRAFSKYQMSEKSPYTVFFTPSTTAGGGSPEVETQGISEVFYSQSQTKTVSVTPETTLIAPAAQTLPGSFFNAAGKSLRIKALGYFSNPVLGPTLVVKTRVGGCQLTTGVRVLKDVIGNQFWELDALFTCRVPGAVGELIGQGSFHYVVE